MVLLTKEEIKTIIPHREPFLLIDEIVALDPGVTCTAVTYIKEDDFWFQGHFPGQPVTPGVLMVEMLAQTAAVCAGSVEENRGKVGLFARIEKTRFKRMVVPGDVLTLKVEMGRFRGSVGMAKGVAAVDGEIAVQAELTFAYQE